MAYFNSRDYLTQSTVTTLGDHGAFQLAAFLHKILGFTIIGQTNFNINAAPYLISSGTAAPNLAGVNQLGSGKEFDIVIPVAMHTVTGADVGRQLLLKSTAHPTINNGFFLVTAINSGDNALTVSFRTTDSGSISFPPPEPGGGAGVQWWLYEDDAIVPSTRGSNGGTGYHGSGISTCSRIILQSPHSTAWQVRICCEYDSTAGASNCPGVSVTPGFNGNGSGDFLVGGKHLHLPLWWNTFHSNAGANANQTNGIGFGDTFNLVTRRIWIGGDDGGQAVYLILRNSAGDSLPSHQMVVFGLPDNEPANLPSESVMRLFVWGTPLSTGPQSLTWSTVAGASQGYAFGNSYKPVSLSCGLWTYIQSNAQGGSPIFSVNAGDNPFISSTELLPVHLTAGAVKNWNNSLPSEITTEVRNLGNLPMLRAGRANFSNWTATSDVGKSWIHTFNGVFIPYGGPSPLP